MFTLVLALALAADPAPEVLDFIDPDGDGSITDAEFAAGCKAMAALNKSKKKPDVELLEKLDPDGDGKLSDEEILQLAAEGRVAVDYTAKQASAYFYADTNKDGVISKAEAIASINAGSLSVNVWDRLRSAGRDGGSVSIEEATAHADVVMGPTFRSGVHPSRSDERMWANAARTILRIGGADKRINKLEAGKIKEIHAAFDEIDADGNGQIKLIELFSWLCAQ